MDPSIPTNLYPKNSKPSTIKLPIWTKKSSCFNNQITPEIIWHKFPILSTIKQISTMNPGKKENLKSLITVCSWTRLNLKNKFMSRISRLKSKNKEPEKSDPLSVSNTMSSTSKYLNTPMMAFLSDCRTICLMKTMIWSSPVELNLVWEMTRREAKHKTRAWCSLIVLRNWKSLKLSKEDWNPKSNREKSDPQYRRQNCQLINDLIWKISARFTKKVKRDFQRYRNWELRRTWMCTIRFWKTIRSTRTKRSIRSSSKKNWGKKTMMILSIKMIKNENCFNNHDTIALFAFSLHIKLYNSRINIIKSNPFLSFQFN